MLRRLGMLAILAGAAAGQAPQGAVRFSEVMNEVSHNREFVEKFIERLDRNPAAGGILGPNQVKRLRELIFGKQWEELDRFPGITVRTLGRGVWLAGKTLAEKKGVAARVVPATESLELPAKSKPVDPNVYLKPLGFDLVWGDAVDPELASMAADSVRLADVLNRLSRFRGDGYRVKTGWGEADSPASLMRLLAANGHTVEVRDARYFANFGDLKYKGQDVLTPFWLDTEIPVAETKRTLLVPASHSQHEVRVKGPAANAAIAFYFGIDGKAEFRAMDTKDQGWVMGRVKNTYTGEQGTEAIRVAGEVIRVYDAVHRANPDLPFGGYYALGVCNDVNAMIEQKLQGKTTLYPLTHDKKLFAGHGEVTELVNALPVDGQEGGQADFARVMGSLPVGETAQLPIAWMRTDVEAVQAAGAPTPAKKRSLALPISLMAVFISLFVAIRAGTRKKAARG